ncbi:MAG: porin family protein [Bacteroidales bacterium]|nr:porin family protein [Bacteroidales bacterium]
MKKLLLALVVVMATALGASAQTEIQIGYGGYTEMDACDCHDGWNDVKTAWGALTAGVNFKVAPKIWVGPSYTFSSTHTPGGSHKSKIAYHAFMANGRYEYYRNSIVKLYAHLGVGVVVSHMQPYIGDSYNETYFAIQASPLGADVDLDKTWTLFGEVGFGAQGLIQVGCRIHF